MKHLSPCLIAVLAGWLGGPALGALNEPLAAPAWTQAEAQPFYFAIPAPRGQILDSQGQPLARTEVVQRLTLRVPALPEETAEAYVEWVNHYWPTVVEAFPEATRPDAGLLMQQFEHRRRIPLAISDAWEVEKVAAMAQRPEFVEVQTEYAREYPGASLAAHVLGYVTTTGAPLRGPLQYGEPLWREVEGREGLEASMNRDLTGQAGLMVVCYDRDGRATRRQVLKAPVPGNDVVTTLQLQMQTAVEKALASAKRPGAMVVVNASTGSILAMASAPTFDPGQFARGLDQSTFSKMTENSGQPMFHRAIGALYPPGSVFKLFVALAGMKTGRLSPYSLIPCGPEVMIEGRPFRNWTDKDSGWFDLNAALVRSCNTYFYQAAIAVGDLPVLETARDFGFGQPMQLPIAGVIQGQVPERVPSAQGQANLAIGQSPLLSSPLEVAMVMATLADGYRRPHPRLVAQVQDQAGEVISATSPAHHPPIQYSAESLGAIHNAMYSVVNHREGTGTKARASSLRVFGKTGTSQWSRDGDIVNAVWFAGFVKDTDPPLAFAVALEGRKGERVFGGAVAAPLVASLVSGVAAAPAKYGLRTRKVKAPLEEYALVMNRGFPLPQVSGWAPQVASNYYGATPAAIPVAIPVATVPPPEAFYRQPLPEPNDYYERARSHPRRIFYRFVPPGR